MANIHVFTPFLHPPRPQASLLVSVAVHMEFWFGCTAAGFSSLPQRPALPVFPPNTGAWGRGRCFHDLVLAPALRTLLLFVTSHTFSVYIYICFFLFFFVCFFFAEFHAYSGKADLSKGCCIASRKLGVATFFFFQTLKFVLGKKCPTLLCVLKRFRKKGCFVISEKYLLYSQFSF